MVLEKRHAFGFEEQIDVVGHQDVGEQAKSITLAIMLQPCEVGEAVLVIIKSSLLLIAADNNMAERSVILDSGLGCHGAKTTRREGTKSLLTRDPIASSHLHNPWSTLLEACLRFGIRST